MTATQTYIRRETAVSVAINGTLSLAFFLLIFGFAGPVRVWGAGGYVFDYAPQGFMIAFMATLVPGALAARALQRGAIAAVAARSGLPASLLARAFLLGAIGAGIGVAAAAAILAVRGADEIGWAGALAAKLAFGGLLAAIVTPIGLRATLGAR